MRKHSTLTVILFSFVLALFASRCYADMTPIMTTPQLYYPSLNTVIGNPNGKVTLVEFFDYHCGYCHQVPPMITALIRNNPQLRVVFRDYPVLGSDSLFAARAVLAAAMQGKYLPLHNVLFRTTLPVNPTTTMQLARAVGLDTAQLSRDMQSDAVNQQLDNTSSLAQGLNINGVPTIVIAATPDAANRGAVPAYIILAASMSDMRAAIAKVSNR